MKALQMNKLRKWSHDNSFGQYFQALDALSCSSTFLPWLAAAPGEHCLLNGLLELSLNQTHLPAPGDSLRQDGAGGDMAGFLCCLAWSLPGFGLVGLRLQGSGVSGRLQNLQEKTW